MISSPFGTLENKGAQATRKPESGRASAVFVANLDRDDI